MTDFAPELESRLICYAAIDSQSDEDSPASPSTGIQLNMARLLQEELTQIGATQVQITAYGAVLATIPATAAGPTVGFLAHMDTAPQFNGAGVKPRVIRGGTDGSRLTEMGVPCPNLFTGMQDIHGPLEWISVQDMALAAQLCLGIAQAAVKA